jgi:hypothetical protein
MSHSGPSASASITTVVLPVFFCGYLAMTVVALTELPYDISGAFLVAPVLALISVPMLAHARRQEQDPAIRQMFVWSMVACFAISIVRYYTIFEIYDGVADATGYHQKGAALAGQIWRGEFAIDLGNRIVGTGFIALLTGTIYTLTGPTVLGGYLCYSWIGFWGLYLCYRAFRIAVPSADRRRYALLIFFLPSILFWTSAIGKEAWMLLGIGLILVGSARALSGLPRSIGPLFAGICATALVRPHITALLLVAILAAMLLRRPGTTKGSPVVKVALLGVLATAWFLVMDGLATFVGIDELTVETVGAQLDKTSTDTSRIGNSAFSTNPLASLADLPVAAVTVLFRPFPWEADGVLSLCSAVEGFLLLILTVASWQRWSQIPSLLRKNPYIGLCLTASLLFIVVLSAFGNFGILDRESTMLMPFVFALLCLPAKRLLPDKAAQRELSAQSLSLNLLRRER